ncbi:MAG: beta-lactamase family protein [Chlorobia bacterium]|nr:beta-lactamase family protein [Fimbriimonadaceae bacterium]
MLPFNLILAAAMLTSSQADPATELRAKLDELGKQNFSGVLYMEKDGKEIFFHSVGYADPESKRPFTRQTGIEIGSIVKPVVRVAMLKLAEDGKVGLSDSISKYFRDVPEDKKPITLQMLMNHTSGFQDVFGGDYEPIKRDALMQKMLEAKLLFTPGSKDEYSNCGFSMLATIIEKVTGESLERHIARTQFTPLGLRRFGYVLPNWNRDELMTGYGSKGERWGTPREKFWYKDGPSWNLRGNGGMIATAKDLATWSLAAHGGRLLKPGSYKLFMPSWAEKPPSATAISMSAGGNGIFNTVLAYMPHHKLVLVAASTDGRFEIENHLRPLYPLMLKVAGG